MREKAQWARRKVLAMGLAAGAGHIAPAYSCTEILVALYHGGILRFDPAKPKWPDRDRFVLSKGQAANVLYAVLADLGFFPVEELMTFTREGSRLGGHAEDNIPGVECFTGSLGHGLSIGVGIALAAQMDHKDYVSYVLLGDGESQEGSVWEAAMFASTRRLSNLIAIVDRNGLQAIDFTENTAALEPIGEKWRSFGWDVRTVEDGHCIESLISSLADTHGRTDPRPLAVIAKTTKGKGISFMENKPIWHYRIPEGDEVSRAWKELGP
jgi:transketolase